MEYGTLTVAEPPPVTPSTTFPTYTHQRGKARVDFVLTRFIDFENVWDLVPFLAPSDTEKLRVRFRNIRENPSNLDFMVCVFFLNSSTDPERFMSCARRVRDSLEAEGLLNSNFMVSGLIDIGLMKMVYWRIQSPIDLELRHMRGLGCGFQPEGFQGMFKNYTVRQVSREVQKVEEGLQAADDWIRKATSNDWIRKTDDKMLEISVLSERRDEIIKMIEASKESLSSDMRIWTKQISKSLEERIKIYQEKAKEHKRASTELWEVISAARGNRAVGQGDPSPAVPAVPAVPGDYWKSLIVGSFTLASILGAYIASMVWKENSCYSGLYMAGMILILYWTLFAYPIGKQYGILRRRHSTCRPELKRPLEIQMHTMDLKCDFVAALTCIVLYHSLLMWQRCEKGN